MFNESFYPTPESVLDLMGIDCYGKTVLEPSAGKGDIVKYLKKWGAKEIVACEIEPDLRAICSKHATIISDDFFNVTSDMVSHIDMIVMNPPFYNADMHIKHAWNIAPDGCEIIALCNWETIKNDYSRSRRELSILISEYGESINLGNVFKRAERTTNVEVGLVRLFKPQYNSDELDGFYYDLEEDNFGSGIVQYNELRAVVNTYVNAVKCFDKVEAVAEELYNCTHTKIFDNNGRVHELNYGDRLTFYAGYDEKITTKQQFAKSFQMRCWQYIFNRVNIQKYVTKGVMDDVNKFINSRKNYPFTMKNISKMLDIIYGTREQTMNRAIIEAIDNFTKHTHENRYSVEGWKTNSGHLLNKKFIVNDITEIGWGHLRLRTHGYRYDQISDLVKAICFVTATDYDTLKTFHDFNNEGIEAGKWYDWGFFEFKVFKKGSGHFKFKDENVWAAVNQAYAKAKGMVLPEKI